MKRNIFSSKPGLPIVAAVFLFFFASSFEMMPGNFSPLPASFQKQIYEKVDVLPVYPGGDSALIQFISANIKYPESAKKNGIQGVVIVRFCVTDKGEVENVQVLKGAEKSLDDEAVRVVRMLKGWTPGKIKGDSVNVWYNIPITFKLS